MNSGSHYDLAEALARSSDTFECRLCFDSGTPGVDLIAPCDCMGSMRWVHRGCLNQWRYHAQPTNAKAMTHCPTCAYQYGLTAVVEISGRSVQKRRRCVNVALSCGGGFVLSQVVLFLLAFFSWCLDHEKTIPHMFEQYSGPKLLFRVLPGRNGRIFEYYIVVVVAVFASIGLISLLFSMVRCCTGRATQVRAPNPRYGRREMCVDDCSRSCIYDPLACSGMDCTGCDAGNGCDCRACGDGEGAIVILGLALIALVFIGIFVAVFFVSMLLQRMGQRYVKALRLKDIAEQFPVVDRSSEDVPPGQEKIQSLLHEEVQEAMKNGSARRGADDEAVEAGENQPVEVVVAEPPHENVQPAMENPPPGQVEMADIVRPGENAAAAQAQGGGRIGGVVVPEQAVKVT